MPECKKCFQRFHPDLCVLISENQDAVQCVFCKVGKNEVTIQNEKGNDVGKLGKQEAINRYAEYIKELCEKRNIKSIIETGSKPKIIMPGEY